MTSSDPTDIPTAKALLRPQAMAVRRAAALAGGDAAAGLAGAAEALLALAGACPVVAGYWPIGDEIDTRPLLERLAALGCGLALPAVCGRMLEFRRWMPGDGLVKGPFSTRQPCDKAGAVDPSLILVPLLAFDRRGFRLGYGGGYYDRTLERLRSDRAVTAIGVAYAAQAVAAVPHDSHDQRLDRVVTEDGLIGMETV